MADIKIVVRNNGPYRIEGEGIVLTDETGNAYDLAGRTVISLCRCGQSSNKPFCDGTHGRVGFQSECQGYVLPPPKPKV